MISERVVDIKWTKGDALPIVEKRVTQAQIEQYAVASGDFNPIHVDVDFAATSRFGSTVAHGMMIAACISEAMMAAFDREWIENGRLKLRFKVPVYPGDVVSTFGKVKNIHWDGDVKEIVCAVGVLKQDGQEAIIGEASVKQEVSGES